MIASLMMYRRPELVDANDRFWNLIRDNLRGAGIDAPEKLSQDAEEFFVWEHPDLVLSQTCGMPYRTRLHDKVELIGTPDYGVQGAPPGYYRSAIVIRADDPRTVLDEFKDAVFAYNQTISQSGYAAPYWHLAPRGFWFKNRTCTQQHLLSAKAVASGEADIAALDAISWQLMNKYEKFASGLRVLEWTEPTPGLPLIAAHDADVTATYESVGNAIAQLQSKDRSVLGLKGIVKIFKEDYMAVKNPP